MARAGEVDARILGAAARLFLTHGYEATSFEQVALAARAGKATLYARFGTKDALFAAVIDSNVKRAIGMVIPIDAALSLDERLFAAGTGIVRHSLKPEPLALMRLIIAEADRFPELAQRADEIGRKGGVQKVAEAIAARQLDHANIERAWPAAERFIDLVFMPNQMRALLGQDREILAADLDGRTRDAIAMMVAVGLLEGWT